MSVSLVSSIYVSQITSGYVNLRQRDGMCSSTILNLGSLLQHKNLYLVYGNISLLSSSSFDLYQLCTCNSHGDASYHMVIIIV